MKPIVIVLFFALAAAAPAASQEAAESSEIPQWQYDAVVYGWLAGLKGTIGVGDQLNQPVDATFGDLKEMVNFAMAGHFEMRNPKAVFLADVAYTSLGSSQDGQVGDEPVTVDLDINQWIIELGGGFSPSPEFDVLFAWRYYILDMGATGTSTFDSRSRSNEQKWGDIFIGGRFHKLLLEKWIVSVRGDIGAGGSDFAWFANIGLGYQFTDLLSALVSWRVLYVDREANSDGNYFKYDMKQSGLGIGLGFSF